MELTEIQIAGLTQALATLKKTPDWQLPMSVIRRNGGDLVVQAINKLHAEYVDANKAAANQSSLLSADALDYWHEARQVLAYGRLALSMGSRAAEKQLSLKCEALNESFDARVPDAEKSCFLVYDINVAAGWDERWHACVDFNFPLLRPTFVKGAPVISSPMRQAQIDVLSGIVEPVSNYSNSVDEQKRTERVTALRETLMLLAQRDRSSLRSASKAAEKKAKVDARNAKIAAGDQEATRDIRGRKLKQVDELFSSRKGGTPDED